MSDRRFGDRPSQGWSHAFVLWRPALALAVLVAMTAGACASPRPITAPSSAIHSSRSSHPPEVEALFTPAAPCGNWATDPSDPTAVAIAQAAGPIAHCQLVGYTWVIITAGVASPPAEEPYEPPPPAATYSVLGAVLTDACAPTDTACLDPSSPHPFSSWRLTRYPSPTYFQPADLLTPTVFLTIGTSGQLLFNMATGTWFSRPSSALATCINQWGAYESSTEPSNPGAPTVSMEQAFIDAHPECTSAAG